VSLRRRASRVRSDQAPIRVSEIGEYTYCSRAWWYKHVVKVPLPEGTSGRLAAGTRAHRQHGSWVLSSARLRAVGLLLAAFGLLMLVLALWIR